MAVLDLIRRSEFFELKRIALGLIRIDGLHLGPDHAFGTKRPDSEHKGVQVPARAAVAPRVAIHVQKIAPEERTVDLVVKADRVVAQRNRIRRVEFFVHDAGKFVLGLAHLACRLRRDAGEHAGKHIGQIFGRRLAVENVGFTHRFKVKRRSHPRKLRGAVLDRIQSEGFVVVPVKSRALRHKFLEKRISYRCENKLVNPNEAPAKNRRKRRRLQRSLYESGLFSEKPQADPSDYFALGTIMLLR